MNLSAIMHSFPSGSNSVTHRVFRGSDDAGVSRFQQSRSVATTCYNHVQLLQRSVATTCYNHVQLLQLATITFSCYNLWTVISFPIIEFLTVLIPHRSSVLDVLPGLNTHLNITWNYEVLSLSDSSKFMCVRCTAWFEHAFKHNMYIRSSVTLSLSDSSKFIGVRCIAWFEHAFKHNMYLWSSVTLWFLKVPLC